MSEPPVLLIESPNQDIDFETLNEQKKKVDFSYDRQVKKNPQFFIHLIINTLKRSQKTSIPKPKYQQ